ncbi:bidirectional sugar transporter SWEET4 isoform 2 [Oryza sativa Japonica Group]|uniref:bidirectional sugar transporter SWEET4 isoform 2 n=1 Tax=Oryza sativa subsp. japonica TaxID=39947 RepID=UPI00234A4A67|nr:bidirectional sugar transporter SWEET4 isoform 2 [Oryza sativa Japonica Group]
MQARAAQPHLIAPVIPNGLGVMFAVAQLILYAIYYKSTQQIIEARKRKEADHVAMTDVVVDSAKNNPSSGAAAAAANGRY